MWLWTKSFDFVAIQMKSSKQHVSMVNVCCTVLGGYMNSEVDV